LRPEGLPDARPWLDHGCWDVQHPLGAEPNALPPAAPYTFLPVEGESLHQIPVGPVHAGIIEPGHFRFTANGETVVRLEQRLGYVHKGIEALMAGADLERGAITLQIAARDEYEFNEWVSQLLRSYDGGYSWKVLPEGVGALPLADSFGALAACEQDANLVFGVGLGDNAADGIIVQGRA